jgi:hypothetical protein
MKREIVSMKEFRYVEGGMRGVVDELKIPFIKILNSTD